MPDVPNQAVEVYTDQDAKSIGLPTPGALNMLSTLVEQLKGTPLVPKSIANTPNPGGTLFAFALMGREYGLTPMAATQSFFVSPDGRIGMYAKAMMAVMLKAGYTFDWQQRDTKRATCVAKRPNGQTFTSTFGLEDAAKMGVANKATYVQHPTRMFTARVTSDIFTYFASDLGGGGPVYTQEELEDFETPAPTIPTKPDDTGSYTVDAKPKSAPAPETIDVKPQPAQEAPATITTFTLAMIAKTASGDDHIVPMPQEGAFTDVKAAAARAKVLANENGTIISVRNVTGDEVGCVTPDPKPESKPDPAPEPKAKAAPVAKLSPEMEEFQKSLVALVPLTSLAEKTAIVRFKEFFAGYLDIPRKDLTGKPPEFYSDAVTALKACLNKDLPSFASPERAGKAYRQTEEGIKTWARSAWADPIAADMAVDVNYQLGTGLGLNPLESVGNFTSMIEANGMHKMTPRDAMAVMRTQLVTRKGGAKLAAYAAKYGKAPADLLARIESETIKGFISDANPEDVERAVLQLEAVLSNKTPEPAPEPQEEPAEEVNDNEPNLFGF